VRSEAPSTWKSALEFTERCGALSTIEAVSQLLRRSVEPLGYEYFAITRVNRFKREAFAKVILARHWPAGWYERYVSANFYPHDPVARRNRESSTPFRWTDVGHQCRDNKRASLVMDSAAADFGMHQGISVPLYGLHGYEGAVSIAGRYVHAGAEALAYIHLVSVFAGTQMAKISSDERHRSPLLSDREREVMAWAAVGKTAAETASHMNLAISTVDKQIASAMRKLGSATKAQAVAVALCEQQITL
jgi:LuxR family quorum sensing-dependent transcriptional regulator